MQKNQMSWISVVEKNRFFFGGEAFHPRWSGYMQGDRVLICSSRDSTEGYRVCVIEQEQVVQVP